MSICTLKMYSRERATILNRICAITPLFSFGLVENGIYRKKKCIHRECRILIKSRSHDSLKIKWQKKNCDSNRFWKIERKVMNIK